MRSIEIIIGVVAVLALIGIIGWRAPDRSPGEDGAADRERIEN